MQLKEQSGPTWKKQEAEQSPLSEIKQQTGIVNHPEQGIKRGMK